jgi:hypothetical protein
MTLARKSSDQEVAEPCECCGKLGDWLTYRCDGDEYLDFCPECAAALQSSDQQDADG